MPHPTATVLELLTRASLLNTRVTLHGWIRTARRQKKYTFLEVNDGSSARNVQVVLAEPPADGDAAQLLTGASVRVTGTLSASPKPGQAVELAAERVRVVGGAGGAAYPLQK